MSTTFRALMVGIIFFMPALSKPVKVDEIITKKDTLRFESYFSYVNIKPKLAPLLSTQGN